MERIKHIKARLERWQAWYFSVGSTGAVSWLTERVDSTPAYVDAFLGSSEDAVLTDQAVANLPLELRRTVMTVYRNREGLSMGAYADRLRITRATLHNRLCHADLRIDAWLRARQDAQSDRAAAVACAPL